MIKQKSGIAFLFAMILVISLVQVAYAISPNYLPDGRTFDQDRTYIQWNGSVAFITLYHKDQTTIPPEEGGDSCSDGCTEQVTRIQSGSSISGNFTNLLGINVQVAQTGVSSSGTAIIRACGQIIASEKLYKSGAKSPGFYNAPSPMWSVPTAGDCTWSITASGGYVDFRAITVSSRPTPAPTVDLLINNTQGSISQTAPAGYTLNWTSTNATSCSASGNWSGAMAITGAQSFSGIPTGIYTYTLTCSNTTSSASDTVTAYISAPPTVDVKANNLDGPLSLMDPAAYSITWVSTNTSTCQAEGNLTGSIGLNGSQSFNNIHLGSYTYTVRCSNPVGASVVDSAQVSVVTPLPIVDLKVDGMDGPLTRVAPADISLSWTSQYAATCSASSVPDTNWTGSVALNGSQPVSALPVGEYTFPLTCSNASGSTNDTVQVSVIEALSGTISVDYAQLLLFAPNLGQPAQTITGMVTGGIAPYSSTIHVRLPFGLLLTFIRNGDNWTVSPENSGDINFGTTEQGTWTAWADLRDGFGQTYQTPSVTWEVAWHPVHGLP
jgi:hypothetical protein